MNPTAVYETFWSFAAERQRIFWLKQSGAAPPYAADPILATYKFTNPYRATDRISQFLLREVIYDGVERTPEKMFERICLFRLFGTERAWQLISPLLIDNKPADYAAMDAVLMDARSRKDKFWHNAYMTHAEHNSDPKHRCYLNMIQQMLAEGLPITLLLLESMNEASAVLASYFNMGDFMAYQWAQDMDYAPYWNFTDDNERFGPGTIRGIEKCVGEKLRVGQHRAFIELCVRTQAEQFAQRGLTFRTIGRPLAVGDIANLFCEVDKYTRVSHPIGDGKRIKQKYKPNRTPFKLIFPPKWGLKEVPAVNIEAVAAEVAMVIDRSDEPKEVTTKLEWFVPVIEERVETLLAEEWANIKDDASLVSAICGQIQFLVQERIKEGNYDL